jgi:chromate transporter
LTIYIGMQLRGGLGATVAACAMLLPAFCVISLMGLAYQRFGDLATVKAVLSGVAAVGVGATLSVGAKIARRLPPRIWTYTVAIATFVTIGLLRWPLVPVVLVAIPLSILVSYLSARRDGHA